MQKSKKQDTKCNEAILYTQVSRQKSNEKTCGSTMVNTDHLPDAPILIPVLI